MGTYSDELRLKLWRRIACPKCGKGDLIYQREDYFNYLAKCLECRQEFNVKIPLDSAQMPEFEPIGGRKAGTE